MKIGDKYYDGVIIKPEIEALCHHGRLGQKWGIRNGPPYPLDTVKVAKVYGKKDDIKGHNSNKQVKTKSYHDNEVDIARKWSNNVEEVWAHPYGGYENTALMLKEMGTRLFGTGEESFEDAARKANPGYGEIGTTNNCTRCAAAVELRHRGYGIVAARAHQGSSAFEYETWFKGAQSKGYSSSEEMKRDLLRNGEGASGALNGYFGDGLGSGSGGHALHWSIKDRHIEIQDGQDGSSYGSFDEAWDHYGFNKGACFATRLDNCEPDWDAMAEDSVVGSPGIQSRKWRQNGKIYDRF